MKKTFVEKLDSLNEQLVTDKTNFRRKIHYLEEDLEQTKKIKDLFFKQVTELQRMNK
jgi:hypothetical protein